MSRSRAESAGPTRSDDLPPAMRSLWRTFQLGYRAEPKLLTLSLGLAMLMMLPDALLALWLKWIVDGAIDGDRGTVITAGVGLAVGAVRAGLGSIIGSTSRPRIDSRHNRRIEECDRGTFSTN